MDLPTYTNIWRIEKRLYKLYDLRLPMPLPLVQIGVFIGVFLPWILLLKFVGIPFRTPWHVLYLVPPGVLTWLATRPVIEGKRLTELLLSQTRYLTEPRTWCRLTPIREPREVVVVARVWRQGTQAAVATQADHADKVAAGTETTGAAETSPPRSRTRHMTQPVLNGDAEAERAGMPGPMAAATGSGTDAPPRSRRSKARRAVSAWRPMTRDISHEPEPVPDIAPATPPAAETEPAAAIGPAQRTEPPLATPQPEAPPQTQRPAAAIADQKDDTAPVTDRPEPVEDDHTPAPSMGSGKRALASGVRRPGADAEFWKAIAPPERTGPTAPAEPPTARPPAPVTGSGIRAPAVSPVREPTDPAMAAAATETDRPDDAAAQTVRPPTTADTMPNRSKEAERRSPAERSSPGGTGTDAPKSDTARSDTARSDPGRSEPGTGGADTGRADTGMSRSDTATGRPKASTAEARRAHGTAADTTKPPPKPWSEGLSRPLRDASADALVWPPTPPKSGDAPTRRRNAPSSSRPQDTADAASSPTSSGSGSVPPTSSPPRRSGEPQRAAGASRERPKRMADTQAPPREIRSGPASPVRPRPLPTPPPPPAQSEAITPPDSDHMDAPSGLRRLIQAVGGGHGQVDSEYVERLQRPFHGTRHIVVLGCTGGAGQTVTTLMLGHTFAQHCGEPIVAIDVNPGPGALARRTRSDTSETLTSLITRADQVKTFTAMRRYSSRARSGLDVITAGKNPLQALDDRDYALAIRTIDRFYSVTMLDAAAAVVARILPYADQIVLVAPASADAPRAVAMTFEWLDGHGYHELRSHAVTVINGVSRRSMDDVEQAEAVARGRCRALVRIPWDDHLSTDRSPRNELKSLRAPTRRAYLALAGVVAGGFVILPERYHQQEVGR